ncbi:hypothetical protein K461DRAFT_282339 [Myriangium duriaei CBS 260.36]|uniref:Uncharacterized protein n=1 Tax=Myriangium duriaei CBS 260.36 TaxID=1168546 RepID=A0A9P4MD68_9PEZI|nr:hypothetical protein K461DRAFT_282339 [Myriangium duriaei CBS 260.36]
MKLGLEAKTVLVIGGTRGIGRAAVASLYVQLTPLLLCLQHLLSAITHRQAALSRRSQW